MPEEQEPEMSMLDAMAYTAQQMRDAYRLSPASVVMARWKRDVLIAEYGREQVEESERRFNIQWVDEWADVT